MAIKKCVMILFVSMAHLRHIFRLRLRLCALLDLRLLCNLIRDNWGLGDILRLCDLLDTRILLCNLIGDNWSLDDFLRLCDLLDLQLLLWWNLIGGNGSLDDFGNALMLCCCCEIAASMSS